jgi:hypothetical protein
METYGKVGDVFMDLLACKLENRTFLLSVSYVAGPGI